MLLQTFLVGVVAFCCCYYVYQSICLIVLLYLWVCVRVCVCTTQIQIPHGIPAARLVWHPMVCDTHINAM